MADRSTRAWLTLARRQGGWLVTGAGVLLLILGWYGASGQAVEAKQIPYLASASLPGAALVVSGAVLIAAERLRRSGNTDQREHVERLEQLVSELHALLVEPVREVEPEQGHAVSHGPGPPRHGADDVAADDDPAAVVTVPRTRAYHRADCLLARGKDGVLTLSLGEAARRGLTPCAVCEPDPLPDQVED